MDTCLQFCLPVYANKISIHTTMSICTPELSQTYRHTSHMGLRLTIRGVCAKHMTRNLCGISSLESAKDLSICGYCHTSIRYASWHTWYYDTWLVKSMGCKYQISMLQRNHECRTQSYYTSSAWRVVGWRLQAKNSQHNQTHIQMHHTPENLAQSFAFGIHTVHQSELAFDRML